MYYLFIEFWPKYRYFAIFNFLTKLTVLSLDKTPKHHIYSNSYGSDFTNKVFKMVGKVDLTRISLKIGYL